MLQLLHQRTCTDHTIRKDTVNEDIISLTHDELFRCNTVNGAILE